MVSLSPPNTPRDCQNWIAGSPTATNGEKTTVLSPYFGVPIATVSASTADDVALAVRAAETAAPAWRNTPQRERANFLGRYRGLLLERADHLSQVVALESGKTVDEARAGLLRGIEVIDFALSVPNADFGGALEVSRGVRCEIVREPLGVVLGITPFNFPAMVPLWMLPMALVTGNCFVLKPSDKVPATACELAALSAEAGLPRGVLSVVHGAKDTVQALLEHPSIRAVAFVGSTPVARSVYSQAALHGKRALCLGGAKNHLLVAPDADPDLTVKAIVDSFTGCAGQRCMAGSVMVTIGSKAQSLVERVVASAKELRLGTTLGALIDAAAKTRLEAAIARAVEQGAEVLLDGRKCVTPAQYAGGNWLGPTVLSGVKPGMDCASQELFGPVLSVIQVDTLDQALELERQSPFGNATSIFTSSGAVARYVTERATSGMLGVNVGVPVPRDPFSFGGSKQSKFGQGDITGPSAVEFWTQLKKITSKWALQTDATWMS
ncbi:MAG TPA: CoA-acylating methylmalonate-semialdehyde dehydrogenase [Polyangiaceae bacterium]|nr:CoA-acylating methylmalonate-semialdehyde dehydrogenase [Polyangiaceae bacterium]